MSLKPLRPLAAGLLLAAQLGTAGAQADKAARLYEDALKRYQARDLEGADVQLKNALQQDSRFLPALLLLAKVSLESGKPGAAEVAFDEALRLGASRSEVAPLLARALVNQGRHTQMLQSPQLAVEGLPPDAQVALLLVRGAAYTDLGDERAAVAAIEQARKLRPDDADTYLAEVPLRIRAGQFQAGLAATERALRLQPESANAHYQRGAVLHAQGQLDAALASYDDALRRSPQHLEALVARAGIWLDRREFERADADLRLLRKAHAQDPRGDYMLALIAEQRGDRAAAQVAMRRVADLIGGASLDSVRYRPQILMLGGLSFHALGEPQKALPYLETLVKQQPRNPSSKLLAQILYEQGQVENGIQVLENYLRLQPQDSAALSLLAQGHTAQNRSARAIQILRQALQGRDSPDLRGALGQALARAGKPTEALGHLENAWKRDPRNTGHGQALAQLLVQLKQAPRAQQVARELVRAQADNPRWHQLLATAQAAGGDLKGARVSLEQALKLAPRAAEPQYALARLDAREGRPDAARQRLEALHRLDENAVDPMLELANLAGRARQFDQAERWLERAVTAAGARELRPHIAIVDLQLRMGQGAKALESAKLLLTKAPDDPVALMAHARALLATGESRAAWSSLAQAGRRVPQEASALAEVGDLQLRAGDLAAAAYTLGKALELDPKSNRSLVLLASVEIQSGELASAARRVDTVMALEPRSARSHLLAAELAQARQQTGQALAALRRAHEVQPSTATTMRLLLQMQGSDPAGAVQVAESWLRRQPKDRDVRRALAELQAGRGQWAAARGHYEQLLAQTPNDAPTLNNLALVWLRLNDLPKAQAHAERALKAAPGSPLVLDTLAWVLHHQGEQERALGLLRDARLRAPDHAEIRYHLAAVLAKMGRSREARAELQAALAKPTGLESVKDAQALLASLN